MPMISRVPIHPAVAAPQQERQGDPGQRRVGDAVPQKTLFPEDGEGTQDTVDDPQRRRAYGHLAERVVRYQVSDESQDIHGTLSATPPGSRTSPRGRGG